MGHRAEITILSDLTLLQDVRSFVRDFCGGMPPPPVDGDTVCRLELALNEAVTNVIKHAYEGQDGGRIHIAAEADDLAVTVHVCHRGKGFDLEAVPEPAFDGSRNGGFGLYIIRQCIDEFSLFLDGEGRECMRLVINLSCMEKGG